ncbi:MAG: cation-translocating P-type ATPase [Clostridia bacterium]|nr:cation-translocating P-type ATPase [Clostridia bacterium]
MAAHNQSKGEVLNLFSSNMETGLSTARVSELTSQYGPNKLQEKKKKTMAERFFDQFKDVMIIILILAAIISAVIAVSEGLKTGHWGELFEPGLIVLIVILNAVMGVMQESKAEKALEALKSLSAPHARVIRNGVECVIDAAELVPGDIIRLEAGDFIPADARLLHSAGLKSEEAALTGESVPSEKDAEAIVDENAPLGDRTNMVFSGCSVTYGTATAIVTATGMDTEMGKIANLLDSEEEGQTPLQEKLAQLGKYLGFVALAACAIVFVIGLLNKQPPLDMFMVAVSLAVSAIPEGLPAIVTIVLSIGVQRMVKRNALIRRLPAVETLGSASVICSDKTGTLTQNRMTLVKAYVDGAADVEAIGTDNTDAIKQLLTYGTLCCDGSVVFGEDGTEQHIGDPTETAIVLAAHKNGLPKDDLNKSYPRLAEIPFDSDRKLMTTVNTIDGKTVVIVKGAFDMMAPRCIAGDLETAKHMTESMSEDALRVLAVAYKEIDTVPANPTSDELENGLTFMGLVGMIDPPRPEAKEAVSICRKAGIKPVMITGDHVVTASAIARELGILGENDRAITGAELDAMTDDELDAQVESIAVYARVSPENKIRIVKAWQRKGQVVSMTGDGVNDAPALKAADIGCAMGITGTDVAKGAADMTLTDDNFATIVDAVHEGRGIYANIKKVVGYLLGTNIGEVITVFVATLLWGISPLVSMQLLWINLVTDSLPAIALGMEPVEDGVMNQKPKPKNEGIFANGFGLRIVLQGVLFAALTLVAFWIGCGCASIETIKNLAADSHLLHRGETMAFIVLALCQIVQAFNMRSDKSLFKVGFFGNKTLNLAALAAFGLTMAVCLVPGVQAAFELEYLTHWFDYLICLGLVFVPLVVMELAKAIGLIKQQK